jgi:hypothetical protein
VQLADLAHGFVENSRDNAPMGMGRRADESSLQAKAADEALALLVEHKLQLQSGLVLRTATEALVTVNPLFDCVSMDWLVTGHATKMKQSRPKMQEADDPWIAADVFWRRANS